MAEDKLTPLYKDLYFQQMTRRDQISSSVAVPMTAMAFVAIALGFLIPEISKGGVSGCWAYIQYATLALVFLLLIWSAISLLWVEWNKYTYPNMPSRDAIEQQAFTQYESRQLMGASGTPEDVESDILGELYEEGYLETLKINEARMQKRDAAFKGIILVILMIVLSYAIITWTGFQNHLP